MGNAHINDILMEVLNGAQSGDPQAMLIAGLSGALILILLLMVIIAVMGRKSGKSGQSAKGKEQTPVLPAEEPQIQKPDMADTAASQVEKSPPVLDSADAIEQTDDFMIFKRSERPAPQRKEEVMPSAEGLTIEDNLQLIEREMIKLRDMFKQGHVTRDVYVDETRNLYHQARAIAALR